MIYVSKAFLAASEIKVLVSADFLINKFNVESAS